MTFCGHCHGRGTLKGMSRVKIPVIFPCDVCKGTGEGEVPARVLAEALLAPAVLAALDAAPTPWQPADTAPLQTYCLVKHVAWDSEHIALAEREGHEDPGYWTVDDGSTVLVTAWKAI